MKRMIIAGLSAALALAIATAAPAADKKTLVFVVNGASDFWKIAEAGVKKAQGELPNYDLQFKYPEQAAAAVQQRVMDDLVAAGAAAIMVSAVDPKNRPKASTRSPSRCRCSPPIAMRRSRSGSPISAPPTPTLGKEAGKLMLKALPNGGKCVGFVGLLGADNARERIEGVKEVLKGSKVELVDVRGDEIDQTRAKRNVEDTLAAMPDVTCLVGFYSYNTPRIYEVLKEAGKLGQIKVIGFDEDPITLGGVKEGSHRRHGRPAALRVGLSGHEADGQVSREATSPGSRPTGSSSFPARSSTSPTSMTSWPA